MPEAFKNIFSEQLVKIMAGHLARSSSSHSYNFKRKDFIAMASNRLTTLELKARSNQIADALAAYMPDDFTLASNIIHSALDEPSDDDTWQTKVYDKGLSGWMMMPITDYIAEASLTNNGAWLSQGLRLLHACTQRFSAEFSIRPFLRDYTSQTLVALHVWAKDESVHVRRLVSEGSRPYLPWGIRLKVFANNPAPLLPLLTQLKDDPSEYVRRSVANNLNDIAKDHPDLVVQLVSQWWDDSNKPLTKLIKHACRTLIKDGHAGALSLFGYRPAKNLNVDFSLSKQRLGMGGEQVITLNIENNGAYSQSLLIDYIVHHQKANGKMTPKVFKWTSLTLPANGKKTLTKKHSLRPVTTRKYYKGQHKVEVLVNGQVYVCSDFELC